MIRMPLSAVISNAVAKRLGYDSNHTAAVMAGFLGCITTYMATLMWAAVERRAL